MKYSTVIVIASQAITLAAAYPAPHHFATRHSPEASPHSPSRRSSYTSQVQPLIKDRKDNRQTIRTPSVFTHDHASENASAKKYSNDPYATDTHSNTGIHPRFKIASILRNGKKVFNAAISAAGGSAAALGYMERLASSLYKPQRRRASATDLSARDPYATNLYAQELVYRRDEPETAGRGRSGSGKQRLPPQIDSGAGEDKHISAVLPSRDLMDDDELLARDGWWGYVKSNHLNHEEDHATHSAKAPVVTRESDEGELEARSLYLDENLFGRSFGEDKEISARYLIEEDFALRGLEDYLDSRDDIEEFEFLQRRAKEELEERSFSEDEVDLRDFNIDKLD
ncbi:hypothetical protein H0H87_009426 [Tephrocybe sp. NHM501043]|nr:hypothetical protein H0H87_009426 [Tephrocybe sp. NHM501043]